MDAQNANLLRMAGTGLLGLHFVVGVIGFVLGLSKLGASETMAYGAGLMAAALSSVLLGMTVGFAAICLADIHGYFRRQEGATAASKPKLAPRRVTSRRDDFPADWLEDKG